MYFGHTSFFGGLGMALFWIVFIWLIVWLIRQNKEPAKESPLDVIKTRYAKGEITKKQYDEMKKDIG